MNSILFVAALVMLLIFFSMLGGGEQEASQLLAGAWIALYLIANVALFALLLLGRCALRSARPTWVKVISLAGLISSVVSLVITVYPIIGVPHRGVYAAKICAVVVVSNLLGVVIYKES